MPAWAQAGEDAKNNNFVVLSCDFAVNRRLILLLVVVLAIKAMFLALDPEPSFTFGDSGAYLATAIGKWIPPDHSFVYGLMLRPLAVWPRSLEPVVILQAVLSGIASWLVAVCLVRYFAATFPVAGLCALACAVEPLQLLQERYVLTESIAVFVFALFVWLMFSYVKTSAVSTLALTQIVGVLLISLRINFLPVVVVMSFILPLLSRRAISVVRSSQRAGIKWIGGLRFVLLPVLISIVISQTLLFGYRHLYGELLDSPPAYSYRDGLALAADFAPIVQPIDFPIEGERQMLFKSIRFPMSDPQNRRAQRWMEGGFCDVLYRETGGNEDEANRLARETAMRAIERDPWGVVKLTFLTYREYFDYSSLKWNLQLEEGRYVEALPREAQMIKDVFGIDVAKRGFSSLTKSWHERSVIWCWFLLVMPVFYAVSLFASWRRVRAPQVICGLCGIVLLAGAVIPVESPNPRHLLPLAWLAFIMIGSVLTSGRRGIATRRPAMTHAVRGEAP